MRLALIQKGVILIRIRHHWSLSIDHNESYALDLTYSNAAEELTTRGRPTSSVPIKMRDFYKRNMFEQIVSTTGSSTSVGGSTAALTSTAIPRQRPSTTGSYFSFLHVILVDMKIIDIIKWFFFLLIQSNTIKGI